jgi:hypothetical protein
LDDIKGEVVDAIMHTMICSFFFDVLDDIKEDNDGGNNMSYATNYWF